MGKRKLFGRSVGEAWSVSNWKFWSRCEREWYSRERAAEELKYSLNRWKARNQRINVALAGLGPQVRGKQGHWNLNKRQLRHTRLTTLDHQESRASMNLLPIVIHCSYLNFTRVAHHSFLSPAKLALTSSVSRVGSSTTLLQYSEVYDNATAATFRHSLAHAPR
ncbi:hypothetical protein CONLIGDRAFT_383186 [Coniochaeta ligniaria NRRL 30616]|uniref:Uncharacterized protein n=1 Tax=Coniochaeta ligniaria NRRL 30616 TaxID=1408157 RepID=A0A1J7IMV6_9PEZI|nr:hypothetical protein CONLIGDRAFT_383186 [Coniochaeta ligniaria NRRL 30616]